MPELRSFLRNPQVEPDGKADVLEQLAGDADELVRNFVRLVAEKGRAGELPEIARELEALVARAQNRSSVELTTSYELSDDGGDVDHRDNREGVGPQGRGDRARSTRASSAASSCRSDRTAPTAACAADSNVFDTNSQQLSKETQ